MSSSVHPPDAVPARGTFRPLWALATAGCPRGLALARERGWVLAWDDEGWLYLGDRGGKGQGQVQCRGPVTAAACADDGSAFAAAGGRGELWWLAPDLAPRWERSLPERAVALALDPFGQYLVAADAGGRLHGFDRRGRALWQVPTPRPLVHLAFIPEAPLLVGAADFGLVAGFDLAGQCLWRDGLVANIGALAASGDGARIVLACFSDGLRCYRKDGRKDARLPVREPCRLVAMTYDGRLMMTAGLGPALVLLGRDGEARGGETMEEAPAAVALGPLGDVAFVALPGRRVVGLVALRVGR